MISLSPGQQLIRETKNGRAETCTVERIEEWLDAGNVKHTCVVLTNGERVAVDGWSFDEANPSRWVAVEPAEELKRTIDEVFEAVFALGREIESEESECCSHAARLEDLHPTGRAKVEALRAELKTLVEGDLEERIREHLETLTDEQRVEFFATVVEDYCEGCGRESPEGHYCQCQNDE